MSRLEEIKRHRRARVAELVKGVGQNRLSALTGVAASYLYAISIADGKSARPVNDETAETLCRKLGLPRDWIDSDDPLPDLGLDEPKALPAGWEANRAANDTEVVQIALSALFGYLASSQPGAGAALVSLLERAPKKYLEHEGLLPTLIAGTKKAAAAAKARATASPGAKRRS